MNLFDDIERFVGAIVTGTQIRIACPDAGASKPIVVCISRDKGAYWGNGLTVEEALFSALDTYKRQLSVRIEEHQKSKAAIDAEIERLTALRGEL